MLTGADDSSYDVITLGTYFSIFFYIRTCLRFALIRGNLTTQKYISRNCQIPRFDLDLSLKKAT